MPLTGTLLCVTKDPVVDLNTVLGKAVTVLWAFSVDDYELSLAALVERTGLPKSTARRVAGDLVHYQLLDKTRLGYRPSRRLFELGMRASVERSLIELAMPLLQDLYERTHEIVHLGVREGHEVVYIAKIGGRRQANIPSRTGGRMPLYCTAIGKVLLAFGGEALRQEVLADSLGPRTPYTIVAPGRLSQHLDAVLETGVAYEREESTLGIQCVAAPVLDSAHRPLAAISITGPVGRFRPELHADVVRSAALALGSLLDRRRAPR